MMRALPLWVALTVLVAALITCWSLFRAAAHVAVRPVAPRVVAQVRAARVQPSAEYLDGVMRRNLFDEAIIAAWNPAAESTGPVVAKLDVTLLGTVVTEQPELSSAMIRHQDGITRFYGLQQEVLGHRVASIEPRRVTLVAPNGHETVLMTSDQAAFRTVAAPAAAPSGPEPPPDSGDQLDPIKIDGNMLSRVDLEQLVREGRFVPEVRPDGGVAGLRANGIRPGSMADRLGLKEGDVLMALEGQRFDDMAKANEVVQQLASRENFCAEVVRNGSPRLVCYAVH